MRLTRGLSATHIARSRQSSLLRRTGLLAMSTAIGTRVDFAKQALREADAVCFDVDSTVIVEEGIDELADYLGCGEEVAALTAAAMGGSKPFHEALADRLAVMQVSQQKLDAMMDAHPLPEKMSPGIASLVAELRAAGKRVFLVSGGFRQMIEPIAEALDLDTNDVYANTLLFNDDGSFKGYNHDDYTSRAGGKAKAIKYIKTVNGYDTVVMVGDGATDMEARDLPGGADAFIGFGGVVQREAVREGADWFVYDFDEMREVLKQAA